MSAFAAAPPSIGAFMANARPCTAPHKPGAAPRPVRMAPPRAGGNGAVTSSPALLELLQNVASGVLTASDAAVQLETVAARPPTAADGGYASGDGEAEGASAAAGVAKAHFPEVIWGEGKPPAQLVLSLQRIAERQGVAAATRVAPGAASEVAAELPDVVYNAAARTLVLKNPAVRQARLPGTVAIIAAGTACSAVVEECRVMLAAMGCYCFKLPESGVMGMHRIVQNIEAIRAADVVIVVTGADGGIASVVAGLVECPVVALPTSSGYGTAFGGVAPLLGALNSSAPGVTVVNIDSGFGAAMAGWRALRNAAKIREAVLAAGQ